MTLALPLALRRSLVFAWLLFLLLLALVLGVAFQGLFRNPLADPYLMGSASGAAFAVTLFAALLGGLSPAFAQHAVFQHLPLSATFFGFLGALLATLLTLVPVSYTHLRAHET
jgi:iron complex transport system permease protein